uniref:ACB domain-containing protein n=1 Tax=Plectus sambesii TaxID=2011161 RepID=A0A914VXB8_9BILA
MLVAMQTVDDEHAFVRAERKTQRRAWNELRALKRTEDRDKKFWDSEHIRWANWERHQIELKAKQEQFRAYWDRRQKDDADLWRDKDFANAVDKMSRAGYKGKHGQFEVPDDDKVDMFGMYMQATVGDVNSPKPSSDHPIELSKWQSWNGRKGLTREEAQNAFISRANRLLTLHGWNPPPGWS